MASARDFLGSTCPQCRSDILQVVPSTNRMPSKDGAWCPTCKTCMTVDELARRNPAGGLFKRLFGGRPQRS